MEQNKNPFKILQGDLKDVPPEMRKKVMADVARAKLIMDMARLFTSNYGALIKGLLKTNKK
ncbi:hypothetical protein PP182_15880 [Maribacter sp. PR1]|uniref:Uncharacterized protein n=1 Tax=Maribacter cobaltidurans TaxID=1178778 RepID=A0ABU7IXK8_9FLAO|nr:MULTISPECIES: hypothetical protein [Maribacter]MDC6390173.1 hypothetical protein [Maribacter sp. PR1]MEE1977563.1 hypothetical protein [Maribacter cobaltidurans]